MPFYYLQSESFWHLIPIAGTAERLSRISKSSVAGLRRMVRGAHLDEELFLLLTMEDPREVLRTALIQAHFTSESHDAPTMQGSVTAQVFVYSQAFLEQARRNERIEEHSVPPTPVRDQGFQRAVVTAYSHRCALCGISIQTQSNYTAVDAAHIIDWSVSHIDNPRNGMALCKLCHWTFDAGLMSVSGEYMVILSRELSATYNPPGHLSTLEKRGIIGPEQQYLWPDRGALAWHRKHKLL